MPYNWQLSDWPRFSFTLEGVQDVLYALAERVGRVGGLLSAMPDAARTETVIDTMVWEAIKTSEIEGEHLSRADVMSSVRNNLGLPRDPRKVADRRTQGIAQLMIDVRDRWAEPLTEERLLAWHRMLMQGSRVQPVGAWRTHPEPMQVISGPIGRERVHFEAPPSVAVPGEMTRYIGWFNDSAPGGSDPIVAPAVRSAIAHLYFESIHPFEDGNGRIGRALSEKALSQGFGGPVLLSLSRTIQKNRAAYYRELKSAQRSNRITAWVDWFVRITLEAQVDAERQVEFTLRKTRLIDRFDAQVNQRQRKVLLRMLAAGPDGFAGGMTAAKYISLTRTSRATATRDLQDLAGKGLLSPVKAGRSSRYDLELG